MADVDLFCEDRGHELFAGALLRRIAREEKKPARLVPRSTRGGHAKATQELRAWQRALKKGIGPIQSQLLVVLIDANCAGWTAARNDVKAQIDPTLFPRVIIGCPDPHIERWCLADDKAVRSVTSLGSPSDPGKCERAAYKSILGNLLAQADLPVVTDLMEYAPDFVEAMDLYQASKNQPSLKHFIDELRAEIRSF
jgi:hypothetical protein